MNKTQADNIPQEAFDWYDEYAHGLMDRRTFMKKLGSLIIICLLSKYLLMMQV